MRLLWLSAKELLTILIPIGKVIDSLTQNNIAIHMINQGASRISIMIGTQVADADNAVRKIYKTFFE